MSYLFPLSEKQVGTASSRCVLIFLRIYTRHALGNVPLDLVRIVAVSDQLVLVLSPVS